MQEIYTNKAPKPVGPYSQAVKANNIVYLSGQIGLDPKTSVMLNESFEIEVKQVFANLRHVLSAAGLSPEHLVKVDIFLTDINDFAVFNALYDKWLCDCKVKPARQTVEVSALPKNARVEVSGIAVMEGSDVKS